VPGTKINYLLALPPGYNPGKKYELWVALHGRNFGAQQGIDNWIGPARARGAILLAPMGTAARVNDHDSWDLERDPPHVIAAIKDVTEQYSVQNDRIALLGFSLGCYFGFKLLAKYPATFCFYSAIGGGSLNGVDMAGLRQAARHVALFYGVGRADSVHVSFAKVRGELAQLGFKMKAVDPEGVGHDPVPFQAAVLKFYDEAIHTSTRKVASPGDPDLTDKRLR
jgi:predicted peptidase